MTVFNNVLELIGNTPIIKLNRFDTGLCTLYMKMENQNPGGSIKDRIALTMINDAEEKQQLLPGGTIVEATAGNTGVSLAMVAALKGYKLVIVIPDKMSQEKIEHLKAMGAEVILTRSDVSKGHPEYYQDMAERLAKERGAYYINQFGNPSNSKAHELSTAPEIWRQMDQRLDAIVLGAGTSGTVTGLSNYFRGVAPALELVLADPQGSILQHYISTKEIIAKQGSWLVEGIGEDYLPVISDFSRVKEAITVSDKDALLMARTLLQREGIFAGSSTGALLFAALDYCQRQNTPKRVLTFACDTGAKYLSKMYNDAWMKQQGFV